jgi:hypothetical protein
MKGTIITIPVTGEITSVDVTDPNICEMLRKIVGGHIEQVPAFNTFMWKKVRRKCFAFCNEEGKIQDLPINHRATFYWLNAAGEPLMDILVGDIAVVIGDSDFLKEV